jgi:hypothetical protein
MNNFTTRGTDHLDVTAQFDRGYMYDSSTVSLLSGGNMVNNTINVFDHAELLIDGGTTIDIDMIPNNLADSFGICRLKSGSVTRNLIVQASSTLIMSGGIVGAGIEVSGTGTPRAFISGGAVGMLRLDDYAVCVISGGTITGHFEQRNLSSLRLIANDVVIGPGLTLANNHLSGSGTITGRWANGATFSFAAQARNPSTDTTFIIVKPGDANQDGKVDFKDYQILEGNFGKLVEPYTLGDFDGDGKVTFGDYLILEGNFGK